MRRYYKYSLLWLIGLLSVAALTRFYNLAERPYDHDEAIHGWFSYNIANGNTYKFDPVYHGPLLYYTNGALFRVLGASDFTARFLPALASVGLIFLCFTLRREMGRWGWIAASLFIIVSPSLTYYGRFLGHDDYVLFFTLAIPSCGTALLRTGRPVFFYLLGLVMGLFICTKACFYIHSAIFISFIFLGLLMDSFSPAYSREGVLRLVKGLWECNRIHIIFSFACFGLVYVCLYSSFFLNLNGISEGIFKMLGYWSGQQLNPRLPGPLHYYLFRLVFHEPVFYFALAALFYAGRRKVSPFFLFLAFWSISAFTIYSFAQEKVPWLTVHIVLPMCLLAGMYFQVLLDRSPRRWMPLLLGAFILFWSARENMWLCFTSPPDTPHLLKYMSTSLEAKKTAKYVEKLDTKKGQIFIVGDPLWVFAWYLKDKEVTYLLPKGWQKTAQVVITGEKFLKDGEGFARDVRMLRFWWLPDYAELFGHEFVKYFLLHKRPESIGITRFAIYSRTTDKYGQ